MARHSARLVRLSVNSPVRAIMSWLRRLLRMLTESMGGLEHTTPVQATVIRLGAPPSGSAQPSITAGMGQR